MNQWNLTVRQALFAYFYHTRVGDTEVLARFTSLIDPRYVNPTARTARVYPSVSNVAFRIRSPTTNRPEHVCLCKVGANVSTPRSDFRELDPAPRHSRRLSLRFATFSQRDVSVTRRDEDRSAIMVVHNDKMRCLLARPPHLSRRLTRIKRCN